MDVNKKLKEMSKEELNEYKTNKQQHRRMGLDEEKKVQVKIKDKQEKVSKRSNMTKEEKVVGNMRDRDRKREERTKRTHEVKEYEKILSRQKKRKLRKEKIDKPNDEIVDERKELSEWFQYYNQSNESRNLLKEKLPAWFLKCVEFEADLLEVDVEEDNFSTQSNLTDEGEDLEIDDTEDVDHDRNEEKLQYAGNEGEDSDSEEGKSEDEDDICKKDYERETNRKRKYKSRSQRKQEVKQYENIVARQMMRKIRKEKKQSDDSEMKELENSKDKECKEWLKFFQQSEETKNILQERAPDWFAKCEEIEVERTERENERRQMTADNDQCICDYDVNCPYCEAIYEDEKGLYEIVEWTKEDQERELAQYKAMINEERREKRKEKAMKAKEPMPPLPDRELCEYEKIRENNIAERIRE